jgi:hypothetical protein
MGTTRQHHRRDETENKIVRTRQRSDRKNWCRGKVGVEHHFVYGHLNNVNTYRDPDCHFSDGWNKTSGIVKDAYWHCNESEYCENCGKIKRHYLDKDCTKFTGDRTNTCMSFIEFLVKK